MTKLFLKNDFLLSSKSFLKFNNLRSFIIQIRTLDEIQSYLDIYVTFKGHVLKKNKLTFNSQHCVYRATDHPNIFQNFNTGPRIIPVFFEGFKIQKTTYSCS